MKVVILYSQETADSHHQKIEIKDGNCTIPIFIRAEVVESNLESALDCARPQPGEAVLNSIPLPESCIGRTHECS